MLKRLLTPQSLAPWIIAGGGYLAWDYYDKEQTKKALKEEMKRKGVGFSERERKQWNKRIKRDVVEADTSKQV